MHEAWLRARAPGYEDLTEAEREALKTFLFLWSLFEANALGEQGGPASIIDAAHELCKRQGGLGPKVGGALAYFRERYVVEDAPNHRFDALNFRARDRRPLVEEVLTGLREAPGDQAAAVLLIVYRLRNNLFHGAKWAYGLAGQHDNFHHANQVLMEALD
jgi:hypothetical protein